MNKEPVQALEYCLQALERGETIEVCLARFPYLVKQLLPLMETALAARAAAVTKVPTGAMRRGRARLLARAVQLHQILTPRRAPVRALRMAFAAVAALAVIILSAAGLLTASAQSLPGDALYPVKRTVEGVQLQLAGDPQQQAAYLEKFRQRRVGETQILLSLGRAERVEFEGVVTGRLPDGWLVAGIPVMVTPQTQIKGVIMVGVEVEVVGHTQADGSVLAERLTTEEGEQESETDEMVEPMPVSVTETPEAAEFSDDSTDEDMHGSEMEFVGVVESIADGTWVVSGQTFIVTDDTEIEEGIAVGSVVSIKAYANDDGTYTADEIELDDDADDDSQDDDDSSDDSGDDGDERDDHNDDD